MRHKWLFLLVVAGGIVAADQYVKLLVVQKLTTRLDGAASLEEKLKLMYSAPPEADSRTGLYFPAKPEAIVISPSYFRIRYAENPGAAWGLFRTLPENIRGPLFHVVSLGAVVLISIYYGRLSGHSSERWAYFGLPLVLGGALGNYVDRVARGFVIDFLDAHWLNRASWPSFNVADSCICIGVGMLLIDALVRKESKAPAPSKA